MDYSKVYEYIDTQQGRMLQTLDEVVSIPSVRGVPSEGMPYGEGCARVLERFLAIADGMGFVTKDFDHYVGTVSFDGTPERLGILCHLDVVPVLEENWTYPPFRATLHGGRVYGRGTIDDKGPAVAVLYAMKAIKDLGVRLKSNVRYVVGTDEENGSSDLEYYATCESMPPYVFTPDGRYPCINVEKGMVRLAHTSEYRGDLIKELHGGTVINGVPAECYAVVSRELPEEEHVSVESVPGGYRVRYTGLAAHASTPELGDNAITGLLDYLQRFDTSEAVQGLAKAFPHGDVHGRALGIYAEDELSGDVTSVLSIASIEGGRVHCSQDVRFPLCTTKEAVVDGASKTLRAYGYASEVLLAEDPHHTDEGSDFVKTLLNVYAEETGGEPRCEAIGGGTYVHNVEGGVAFGAEFPGEDNGMHGDDESIRLDSLTLNCKVFARAILDVCGVVED